MYAKVKFTSSGIFTLLRKKNSRKKRTRYSVIGFVVFFYGDEFLCPLGFFVLNSTASSNLVSACSDLVGLVHYERSVRWAGSRMSTGVCVSTMSTRTYPEELYNSKLCVDSESTEQSDLYSLKNNDEFPPKWVILVGNSGSSR